MEAGILSQRKEINLRMGDGEPHSNGGNLLPAFCFLGHFITASCRKWAWDRAYIDS